MTQDGTSVAENPTEPASKIMTRVKISHGSADVIDNNNGAKAKDLCAGDYASMSRVSHEWSVKGPTSPLATISQSADHSGYNV